MSPKKKTTPALASAVPPEITKRLTALKTRATRFLSTWSDASVTDTPSFESAGEALKEGVLIRRDLKSLLDPEIKQAKADLKLKQDLFKSVDSLLENAEYAIRGALADYNIRQQTTKDALVKKALDSGKDEKAAALQAKPFTPVVQGLSFTDHWHAEIVDLAALVKAVASGAVPPEAITPNLVYLNAQARLAKQEDIGIPGVKGVKESSSSVRT